MCKLIYFLLFLSEYVKLKLNKYTNKNYSIELNGGTFG